MAYDGLVEERFACAQLKQRFEAAGFHIKENQLFDEDGVRFEIDGFDADRRVGYEYITDEAGDGWDVDDDVIAALAERRERGELHVLIVDEADAPDKASLDESIDEFLEDLHKRGVRADAPVPATPTPTSTSTPTPDDAAAPPMPAPTSKAAKKKARKSR